jgi:hypothetical protein
MSLKGLLPAVRRLLRAWSPERPPPRRRARPGLEVLEGRDCPSTVDWLGGGDGHWETPANWVAHDAGGDANRVPTAADDVAFRVVANRPCTALSRPAVKGLSVYGSYASTLTLAAGLDVGTDGVYFNSPLGAISQPFRELSRIRVDGDFEWVSGALNTSGVLSSLYLSNRATLHLGSRLATYELGDNLVNDGQVRLDNELTVQFKYGASIENRNYLAIVGTGDSVGQPVTFQAERGRAAGLLTNTGRIEVTARLDSALPLLNRDHGTVLLPERRTTFRGTVPRQAVAASVVCAGGTLDLHANGTLVADNGLTVSGGTLVTEGAGRADVVGNVRVTGGAIRLNASVPDPRLEPGQLFVTGTFTMTGGTWYCYVGASFRGRADLIDANAIRLGGTATLDVYTYNWSWLGGPPPRDRKFPILQSDVAIGGDFATKRLDWPDPRAPGRYKTHITRDRTKYELTT